METQTGTIITLANNNTEFYVKESVNEIFTMIKNTMGNNFITLTLLNHSNVINNKLYIRAKSITAIHEEKYF